MFSLNEQQQRHLAVVLEQVDRALRAVIECSRGIEDHEPTHHSLAQKLDDIPRDVAPRILAGAVALRRRLDGELSSLGVPRTQESARRHASAYLTSALILLEDCHSRAMAAYGSVDPRVPGTLDPWLSTLESEVNALRLMLDAPTKEDRSS